MTVTTDGGPLSFWVQHDGYLGMLTVDGADVKPTRAPAGTWFQVTTEPLPAGERTIATSVDYSSSYTPNPTPAVLLDDIGPVR